MKKFKFEQGLLAFYLIVAAASFSFLLLFPNAASFIPVSHYLLLVLALVIAFSGFGNKRLTVNNKPPRYQPLRWLSFIIGIQIAMGIVFYGSTPTYLGTTTETADNAYSLIRLLLVNWGLYPWAMYALLCVATLYYQRQGSGSVRSILQLPVGSPLGLGVDLFVRQCGFLACAVTLAYGIYVITSRIANMMAIPLPFGMLSGTIVMLFPIISLANSQLWMQATRLLWEQRYPTSTIFLIAIMTLILLLSLFNFFNHLLPVAVNTIALPGIGLEQLVRYDVLQAKQLLSWLWWIAWTPLIVILLAQLSQGQHIRTVILGMLALPTLVTMLWTMGFTETITAYAAVMPPQLLTFLSLGIVLLLVRYTHVLNDLVTITISHQAPTNQAPLPISAVRGLLKLITIITVIYVGFGLFPISMIAFILLAPCYVMFVCAGLSLMRGAVA